MPLLTTYYCALRNFAVLALSKAVPPRHPELEAHRSLVSPRDCPPRRASPHFASGLHVEPELGCGCCPLHLDRDRRCLLSWSCLPPDLRFVALRRSSNTEFSDGCRAGTAEPSNSGFFGAGAAADCGEIPRRYFGHRKAFRLTPRRNLVTQPILQTIAAFLRRLLPKWRRRD